MLYKVILIYEQKKSRISKNSSSKYTYPTKVQKRQKGWLSETIALLKILWSKIWVLVKF